MAGIKSLFEEGDLKECIPALGNMLATLDVDEFERFRDEMLTGTSVVKDGKKIGLDVARNIDAAFETDVLSLEKALIFAIEVNFKDFFLESLTMLAGFLHRPDSAEESSSSSDENSLMAG